jgi:hypothetical protein
MSKQPSEPLRGDAAWKAAKQRVSDNNEAAYARGRKDRMARNVQVADQRRAAERRENASLPTQPRASLD